MYRRATLDLKFRVYKDVCPDVVVVLIEGANVFLVATYITPQGTKYRFPGIFKLLQFILKNLNGYKVYLIGDLNARCGTPVGPYSINPDKGMNSYGKEMIEMCRLSNMTLVNGLKHGPNTFDSKFTFFRGMRSKSQNDWCMTNAVDDVRKFKILPKLVVSDHTPLSLVISLPASISLQFIERISIGNFSYDMYDRSNLLKRSVRLTDVDSMNLSAEFNNIAHIFSERIARNDDINCITFDLNEQLYDVCCAKRKERKNVVIPNDKRCLTSSNFRAIAEANLQMYSLSIQRNDSPIQSSMFFNTWCSNVGFARIKERDEYNEKVNKSWRSLSKEDPKLLWKRINYKDEDPEAKAKQSSSLNGNVISTYFKNIFQAERLHNNPTVADVKLDSYVMYVPLLDDNFTMDDLNLAIAKNGNGAGIDGMDKKIAILFPINLRWCILHIFNHVFSSQYPIEWRRLLLRPEEKKGHTTEEPKL